MESLATDRLILRPLVADDAVHFVQLLANDADALRQKAEMPDPCTLPGARSWIEKRIGPGGQVYAVTRGDDGAFLGVAGFGGPFSMPELGYWIGGAYRGRGYATEAVRRLVVQAAKLGVPLLHADTFPDNPASAHVLAKAGFVTTGDVERRFPARGGLRILLRHVCAPSASLS